MRAKQLILVAALGLASLISLLAGKFVIWLCFAVAMIAYISMWAFKRKRVPPKQSEIALAKKEEPNKKPDAQIPAETFPAPRGEILLSEVVIKKSSDFEKLEAISVLDLETTGLSPATDKIVEIGVIEFSKDIKTNEFQSLVNPLRPISKEAFAVNGISDEMVSGAPTFNDISTEVWKRIEGRILAAYNAGFDTSFLKEQLEESGVVGKIQYFDIMSIARVAFPGMRSRKLVSVAKDLGYQFEQTHRALGDVEMAAFVMRKSFEQIKQNELDEMRKAEEEKSIRLRKYGKSPIFDKMFAFTGDFNVSREELESMAGKAGAVVKNSVVMKLDYLVVGNVDNLPEWALERKIRKADRYIEKGCGIKKISESEYLKLIAEAILKVET